MHIILGLFLVLAVAYTLFLHIRIFLLDSRISKLEEQKSLPIKLAKNRMYGIMRGKISETPDCWKE